jgi:hypothetical protein
VKRTTPLQTLRAGTRRAALSLMVLSLGAFAVARARRPTGAADIAAGARRVTPPVTHCDSAPAVRGALAAGASHVWTLCAGRRGRAARTRLRLDARGGGDLDCYLYGPARALVARDDDDHNACALDWRSTDSGTYSLELVNAGGSTSTYSATLW